MRGAGFEPAHPGIVGLKSPRSLTTRPSARNHIFILFSWWNDDVLIPSLTFHIQTASLSPFPSRASPHPHPPPPARSQYDTTCEFARNELRHVLDERFLGSYHNLHIFSTMTNGYLHRYIWVRKYELE